jgi:uncharacterized membrane protein
MNPEDFLWGLKIADTFTMSLVSKMSAIALGVALICFICNLAYNYLTHGAGMLLSSSEDKFPDLMEIARCMMLMFCLTLYTPIAKTVVGTLEVINKATSLTATTANSFEEYFSEYAENQKENLGKFEERGLENEIAEGSSIAPAANKELSLKQGDDGGDTGMIENIGRIARLLSPSTLIATTIHSLFSLLVGIIQLVVLSIAVLIIKLLVILGPFVFAVSILPVFQKQLSVWFGTVCSVGMSFTVINILNHVMAEFFQTISNAGFIPLMVESQMLVLDIAMVGAYCSVFWLSGKIVGHGDAGRIISKAMSVLTTAATVAIAGATMGGSAAASGVAKAASSGKSLIDD